MAKKPKKVRKVTVLVMDDEGTVLFVGAPTTNDTMTITSGKMGSRLVCDIGDMARWLRVNR